MKTMQPEPRPHSGHRPGLLPAGAAILLLAALALPSAAPADVLSASATEFAVETVVDVDAPPDRVWEQLVRVHEWWNGEHSFSGDAANLRLEAVPGGCFCEALSDGGGAVHLTVVHSRPGALLRLRGGLGPLQGFAVTGVMEWLLEAIEPGTRVTVRYRAFGHIPDGLQGWAEPVDGVVSEQLYRLESLIETGSPELPEQG